MKVASDACDAGGMSLRTQRGASKDVLSELVASTRLSKHKALVHWLGQVMKLYHRKTPPQTTVKRKLAQLREV